MTRPSLLLGLLACSGALSAQAPQLFVSAATRPGTAVDTALIGPGGQPFATLLDIDGGPRLLPGVGLLYLGLTPNLTLLDAGTLAPGGVHTMSFPVPAGVVVGMPLYLQSVVANPFTGGLPVSLTDGESTVFYNSAQVLVEDFIDPAAQGYIGTFDPSVRGRLQAAPVRRRTTGVLPSPAAYFPLPVASFLNPNGVRLQAVERAVDIGATGQPEYVTAIRWRPFGPVVPETYTRMAIDLTHSTVVPDYRLDPFTALPIAPFSGLASVFANNIKANEPVVRVFDGPYTVSPTQVRPDGYLPFPIQTPFLYDGVDSLLLDVKTAPSPSAGRNGFTVYLPVPTSPQPNARVFTRGTPSNPLDPFTVTMANEGDNTQHDLQLELTRADSLAISPWRQAPKAVPDWQQPYVAATVPAGASYALGFRGSSTPNPTQPSPFSFSIDFADGQPFLQIQVLLYADPLTGAVPSIDAIVIPVQ